MSPDPTAPADFVRLFTDGACSGNPGPGGWAYILQHPASGRIVDASGAEPATTNNRMELTGAIEGLASLKRRCQVELVTDSEYVGKGLRDWMPKWKAQGWRRKEGKGFKPVVNLDLWQRLDELLARPRREGDDRPRPQRPPRERGVRPDGRRRLQATDRRFPGLSRTSFPPLGRVASSSALHDRGGAGV